LALNNNLTNKAEYLIHYWTTMLSW